MQSYNGHSEDCLCVPCMDADMSAHILANGGQEQLDRIESEMQLIGGGKVSSERMRFMAPGSRCGSGIVRHASPRMLNYLRKLINERDTTKLTVYPGQYITETEIKKNSFQGAKALIDKLLNLPVKDNVPVRMATVNQRNYISNLNNRLIDPRLKLTETDIASVSFAEVNDVIKLLKSLILAESEDSKKNISPITEGAYWHNNLIARVQRSRQSGRLYAKLQSSPGSKEFEYARD